MFSSESIPARENQREHARRAARPLFQVSNFTAQYLLRLSLELMALAAAWYLTIEIRLGLNQFLSVQFDRATLVGAAPPPGALLLLWTAVNLYLTKSGRIRWRSTAGMQSFGATESMFIVSIVAI